MRRLKLNVLGLGKNIILRAIEKEDLLTLHKWANDPEIQGGIGELHFPSSIDFHLQWFENLKNDKLNQRLIVEVIGYGIIGLSSIINIDWRNRHAWHGLVIGDNKYRKKGYGVYAIMATMKYAFDELNLERLDGSMIEYNALSISTYCGKRLGWQQEGIRRRYFYRKGRYWDQILVGITRSDYSILLSDNKHWQE